MSNEIDNKTRAQVLREEAMEYRRSGHKGIAKWLESNANSYDLPRPQIEPRHVWYRHRIMRPDGVWWPGVMSQNGELVLDNGRIVDEIGAYDVRLAHTLRPIQVPVNIADPRTKDWPTGATVAYISLRYYDEYGHVLGSEQYPGIKKEEALTRWRNQDEQQNQQ